MASSVMLEDSKPVNFSEVLTSDCHERRKTGTEANVLVWPPILVGRRNSGSNSKLYVSSKSTPGLRFKPLLRCCYEVSSKDVYEKAASVVNYDQFPLYVFQPSAANYLWALHIDRHPEGCTTWWPSLIGWTMKYATVRDMMEIDPERKLVDWISMSSGAPQPALASKENVDTKNDIGSPLYVSALYKNELQEKLRDIRDAELSFRKCVGESMDANTFASKLKSLLQEGYMSFIEKVLVDTIVLEPDMREAFAFDGAHVASTLSKHLFSLGALRGGTGEMLDSDADNLFTSKMINRGIELELRGLQSTADEIRRATANQQKLTQLQLNNLESTRNLVAKQRTEMLEHLLQSATKSHIILEEDMLCRLKLMASLRQTDEKVSVLQKFISTGSTEIAEEVYSDALKERDQKVKTACNEEHKSELISLNDKVARLSASLKELIEAQSNQECCICYGELAGFSLSSGTGESSSVKKLSKRACFLPCMHANACISCSENRWREGPQECPSCRAILTEKPRVVYL